MSTLSTAGWTEAYDAVDWQEMPAGGAHFLYVDGDYAVPAEAHTRFPDAYTIAIDQATPADEYDVEKGNPDHPVPWAIMMRQRYGYTGRIYCALSTIGSVLDQFTTAGIAPPRFRVADWTGSAPAEVPNYGAGTDGVQYATGQTYDTSLLRPGLAHYNKPAAAAAPAPEDDDMPMANSNPSGVCALSWPAGRCHVIQILTGSPLELTAKFFEGSSGDKDDTTWTANLTANAAGQAVFEIPADRIEACRGVQLTQQNTPAAYYAASAV